MDLRCDGVHGQTGMIISRTPFRLSLFGGGTDYPDWYRRNGGAVLGMAINKYCYISARAVPPFFEHKHRIVYSRIELVKAIDQIIHPAVRAVLTEHPVEHGLEIHYDGDLPARAGLGSSSSFTVGLLNALFALKGQMASKRQLADETLRIEQQVMGEAVGSQDQVWASYGGLGRVDFRTDGSYDVKQLILPEPRKKELEDALILCFTGISGFAFEIAKDTIANLDKKSPQLRIMGQMVDEAEAILLDSDRTMTEIGRLLHESWQLKRELAASVTNGVIDQIYDAAVDAGALGGKVLGAGGGGFMVFYAEPHRRAAVLERLKHLFVTPFKIGSPGSRVIVYEPGVVS